MYKHSIDSTSTLDLDPWKFLDLESKQSQVKLKGINYGKNILESKYKVEYVSLTQEPSSPTFSNIQPIQYVKKRIYFR